MSLHPKIKDISCKECDAVFVVTKENFECPNCGRLIPNHPDIDRNFIPDTINAMLYHKARYGNYRPDGWFIGSITEQLMDAVFDAFDLIEKEKPEKPKEYLGKWVDRRFMPKEKTDRHLIKHLKDIIFDILTIHQNEGFKGYFEKLKEEEKSKILIPFGVDKDNKKVIKDIYDTENFLITGSNKEEIKNYLAYLISSLKKSKKELQIINKKGKEVKDSLKKLSEELEERFKKLDETNKINIEKYNKQAKNKMLYIVLIIEELPWLTARKNKKIIQNILWMGRAVGIYLILTSTNPKSIPSYIKGSCVTTLTFALKDKKQLELLTGFSEVEKIEKQNEALLSYLEFEKPKKIYIPQTSI